MSKIIGYIPAANNYEPAAASVKSPYDGMGRAELNAIAAGLGLRGESCANKAEVIALIENYNKNNGDGQES